jgi:hypothetical protein
MAPTKKSPKKPATSVATKATTGRVKKSKNRKKPSEIVAGNDDSKMTEGKINLTKVADVKEPEQEVEEEKTVSSFAAKPDSSCQLSKDQACMWLPSGLCLRC